jgi:hypothetical protein
LAAGFSAFGFSCAWLGGLTAGFTGSFTGSFGGGTGWGFCVGLGGDDGGSISGCDNICSSACSRSCSVSANFENNFKFLIVGNAVKKADIITINRKIQKTVDKDKPFLLPAGEGFAGGFFAGFPVLVFRTAML